MQKTTISNLHWGSWVVQVSLLDWNGFIPWVKHGWCSTAETHSKERFAGSELLHLQMKGNKHRNQRFGLLAQGSGPPRYPQNGVRGEEIKMLKQDHEASGNFGAEQIRSCERFQLSEFKFPKIICVQIEIKDKMGVKCCLSWPGDIYCMHESNSTWIFPARLPRKTGFILMSWIFWMRARDDTNILRSDMHIYSDMSFCDQFQPFGKLMFSDDPGASQSLFVRWLHFGPEGGIHLHSGQRPVTRFNRSNFYVLQTREKLNLAIKMQLRKLERRNRFEKTVFEKTRKRKITCRSF